jgi:hypothetical protein
MRPAHRQWSAYLREVAEAAEAEIVSGVVTGLEVADGDRWMVSLAAGGDLQHLIGTELSVAGLVPPLHLPVMAGLAQGPGFPNLSCWAC